MTTTSSLHHDTPNEIIVWTFENGFQFSTFKTVFVIWNKRESYPHHSTSPSAKFSNSSSRLCKTTRDPVWSKIHLDLSNRNFHSLMYPQSHSSRGCNRKLLLKFHKKLIRFRQDHGAPVYNLQIRLYIIRHCLNLLPQNGSRGLSNKPMLDLFAEAAELPFSTADSC